MIVIVSSLDAIKMPISVKVGASVICSLLFTMISIYFTFWAFPNENDDSIIQISNGFAISLRSIISSSFRVLTIFFWAQTIKSIKNKKKYKCIIISYHPYIQWQDNNSNTPNPVSHNNNNTTFNIKTTTSKDTDVNYLSHRQHSVPLNQESPTYSPVETPESNPLKDDEQNTIINTDANDNKDNVDKAAQSMEFEMTNVMQNSLDNMIIDLNEILKPNAEESLSFQQSTAM